MILEIYSSSHLEDLLHIWQRGHFSDDPDHDVLVQSVYKAVSDAL